MNSLEWRRSKVLELSSQGHSQPEIARTLQISQSTVNRDIGYLRGQARENLQKHIYEVVPEEYQKCMVGGVDDDADGLIDFDDPDCRPPGEEFRFELSNCESTAGVTVCDAEQISLLPPTYDRIGCGTTPFTGDCGLGRIDGEGNDPAICNRFPSSSAVEVCFVETDD